MEKLSVNGIDLAYEVRGDGPPLLMLHGFFGSSGDWVHLFDLDALAKRWRLVMPDARGHVSIAGRPHAPRRPAAVD